MDYITHYPSEYTEIPTSGDVMLPGCAGIRQYREFMYFTLSDCTYGNFDGNGVSYADGPGGTIGTTYAVEPASADGTPVTATFTGNFNLVGSWVSVYSGCAINIQGDFGKSIGGQIDLAGSMNVAGTTNLDDTLLQIEGTGSFIAQGETSLGNAFIEIDGNFTAQGSANLNSANINVDGTLTLQGKTSLDSASITINGGTVDFQKAISSNTNLTIDFNNNKNSTLIISAPNEEDNLETINIKNYVYGATIEINYGDNLAATDTLTTSYDSDTHSLTIYSNGKSLLTLQDFYTQDSNIQAITKNINGNEYIVVNCFLAGSMVHTPTGPVAVEDIQIGDEVIALDWQNNQQVARPVIWAGKAQATVIPDKPDDQAGYPVRILKNALANGVPYKDMLITAEHCLFFEGKFVPARMLVNGASIFYDKSITSYNYYHIETEQHSVITADGVLTESYLDTGNRASFRQIGKIITLGGCQKTWQADAAAPLCVKRPYVEPLFHNIAARAHNIVGHDATPPNIQIVHNPDLRLVTEKGAIIRPARHTNQQYTFMLPPNTTCVRIVSNASRPTDVIGAFMDDRRYMGVAVADVHLLCAKQAHNITAHLQDEKPEGWHDTDWTDCAWTNGDAVLPLGEHLTHGKMGILSMTIRAAGPYCVNTLHKKQAVA